MAEYNIKSATTGQIKYTGTMRYIGTFLKPGYCEFQDIGSPTKINWEVGDYIDYPRTGLRYKLYTIPSQAKQSQANKYGAAFLYENVQFFDATKDLEMPFIDLVPDDNEESFSTLNTVAFVGTPENVAERVQACLNHWLPNANWEIRIISGLNPSTDSELIETLATEAEFNVSGATCQEALEKMYDIWNGLGWSYSFENSKNVITIGAPNKRTASNTTGSFSYGNGLTHLRKTTGNADEIGTRLYAFGSMKNMLGNYYRDKDIKDADSVDIEHLMLPINAVVSLDYRGWGYTDGKPDARKAFIQNANAIAQLGLIPKYAYFDGTDDNYPEIFPSVEGVTIGDIIDAKDSGNENMKCSVCGYEYDPEVGDPEGGIAPGTPFENLPDDWVCPICGAGKDEFVVPDKPELAHYTRSDRVDEVIVGTSITDDGTQAKGGSKYTQLLNVATQAGTLTNIGGSDPFLLEILSIPVNIDIDAKADIAVALTGYVDIENGVIDELSMSVVVESAGSGVEEFPITLTPTATIGRYSFNLNKTSKDIPFSNGIGYLTANVVVTRGGYATIDFSAVINAGTISVGVSEKLADTFKIRIPQVGFDIDQYADLGEGKTISMKSGLCAGRDFKIKSTKYISSTDCWELTCSRSKDDDMGVLFPNVDSQIDAGDRFVLLDIAMPELYIKIASVRLLKAAQKLLADIDHIKPYYEPEIDAKHVDSNSEVLREGMYMHLVTDEIVDGGNDYAIIDSLEIDENGLIPTFVVKLRKKKAVTWTENISKGNTTKSSSDTSKNEDYITESRADKKYQPKGDYPTRKEVDMFFERYTLPNNAGTAIKLKEEYAGMFADGWISAGGLSTGGGGGGSSLVALRSWANYNPLDTAQVLGSNLGKALKDTTDTLAGYFTGSAANNALALGGHADSYFAHQVKLGTVAYNAIDGIVSLPAYPTTLPASDVYAWAKKAALDVNDVPNITTGKISDLETWIANKGFVTKAVNDLTNYYLKSETYTQAEVNALIAAINQFHYEIYPSLASITSPATNVLYLIGPTGSGSDKYEEYVYSNSTFVKIGDTSIDLSGYVNAITNTPGTARNVCPDCGYVYDPSAGDPDAGIQPGTAFADLPSDWECPICGASKEDFVTGNQFVSSASKSASSSTIAFTNNRITLADIDGANLLKGIQNVSGTTGVLKKTGYATWELDPNAFPTSARELTDADDLCYVDPDEGVSVVIDDPGTTGTVLWGAESANQVALSVNGTTKLLLKSASIDGIQSSINTLLGYFVNGSARNAWALGGHGVEYFATESGLTALQAVVAGKQDTIVDLASIRSQAAHGETAYGWGNHASAGYATQSWVNGQLNGYAHQVVVDGNAYEAVNGTVELPDYPTTLPASDVYPWAKASTKPSYNFSEIGSKPTTLAGYGITDAYISNGTIVLGSNSITPLTSHQSLAGYAHQVVVNGDAFEAIDSVIELPDYPTTLPASDVYAWAKAATKPSYAFSELTSHPTTLSGYGITDAYISNGTITLGGSSITPVTSLSGYATETWVGQQITALNLGAASQRGVASAISDNNNDLTPSGLVYSYVNTMLSSVLKWIGETTTDVATNPTANPVTIDGQSVTAVAGNVVSLSGTSKEFRFDGTRWKEMGDEASYAYKTVTISAGTGLTGGGTLEANRTISLNQDSIDKLALAATALQPAALTGYVNDISVGSGHTTTVGFVSGVTKTSGSSTIEFDYTNIYDWALASTKPSYSLSEITGTTDLQAIEVLADNFPNGGILSYNHGSWQFDTSAYITGITSSMVTTALGYTPFDNASFTQANIQSTLGISNWALAASKPSYNFSEIGSTPTTLAGYGITDAKIENGVITLGSNTITPITSLSGYVNAITKSEPSESGTMFVSAVSKTSGSSTISFTFTRLGLSVVEDASEIQAIETLGEGEGAGFLKKTGSTWAFDTNTYLTGITSSMVTTALGYTPFNSANFTQANIQSTLGISNWALAANKPSYAFSELSSHPTTLSGYGITDAAAASDLLSYLPLSGGTMTGQLVVPSLRINGLSTDYATLTSNNGELYVGAGALNRLVFDTENYTTYVYTKAQIDTSEGVLASGISSNSARLDSIEDWILGVNADTVGLGLVENVALSTWAGSGNITTLGTITSGVWNGTNIAANKLAIDFDWVFVRNSATYDTEDYIVVN